MNDSIISGLWSQANDCDTPHHYHKSVLDEFFHDSSSDSDESSSTTKNNYTLFKHPKGQVIIINKNKSLSFHGLLSLNVICGEVEILGCNLNRNSGTKNVYSSRGTALLYVKNINTNSDKEHYLRDLLPLPDFSDLPNEKVGQQSSVLLCTALNDKKISYVEKHIAQQIFPRYNNNLIRLSVEPAGDWNVVNVNEEWDRILSNVGSKTKIMYCGGKGVGKSTCLRYSVNRLLARFPKIRVVDLDPGQSEFTVPGTISLLSVGEPIFGCSFSHITAPERSILTSIDVSSDPQQYLLQVKHLMGFCNSMEQMPTLINCMGYPKGVGLNIMSATIVHVQPTDLVQMNSANPKKNFAINLHPNLVREAAQFFLLNNQPMGYRYFKINSMCRNNKAVWELEPRQVREMSILAYFGQMVHPIKKSLFDVTTSIFEINLSDIKLVSPNAETVSPAVVNGNLVALCSLENEQDCIFLCHGWGIVRGIDVDLDKLLLLTPENLDTLNKTSHLVCNSVTLPPSIYMTPDEVSGEIPYVMSGDLVSFGQITKRAFLPSKK